MIFRKNREEKEKKKSKKDDASDIKKAIEESSIEHSEPEIEVIDGDIPKELLAAPKKYYPPAQSLPPHIQSYSHPPAQSNSYPSNPPAQSNSYPSNPLAQSASYPSNSPSQQIPYNKYPFPQQVQHNQYPTPQQEPLDLSPLSQGHTAPLFIKIEKYKDVITTVQEMKLFMSSVKSTFALLQELEQIRNDTINIMKVTVQRLEKSVLEVDSELLRPRGINIYPQKEGESKHIESSLSELHRQITELKQELRAVK